ncbi:MAG: hypothetical protein JW779_14465 [Candidatus Thorarchaeota archaeon]|nr:hypothetical protein [Candidatus Thorarchaeota archaeon]
MSRVICIYCGKISRTSVATNILETHLQPLCYSPHHSERT